MWLQSISVVFKTVIFVGDDDDYECMNERYKKRKDPEN